MAQARSRKVKPTWVVVIFNENEDTEAAKYMVSASSAQEALKSVWDGFSFDWAISSPEDYEAFVVPHDDVYHFQIKAPTAVTFECTKAPK